MSSAERSVSGVETRAGSVNEAAHVRAAALFALRHIAAGLLRHPANAALRRRLVAGLADHDTGESLTAQGLYRQLSRLLCRLLFLLAVEARAEASTGSGAVAGLLRPEAPAPGGELWPELWALLDGPEFGPPALPDLAGCALDNATLAAAAGALHARPTRLAQALRIPETLGGVYEALLAYTPRLVLDPGATDAAGEHVLQLALTRGGERKASGSYYTPPELVWELLESALVPVARARLKAAGERAEARAAALLALRIVDPACGGGHFLLAAARRLGGELAQSGAGEPRHATAEVIARCVYGVDRDPLAAEVCRLALRLESGTPFARPLSSALEAHIRCGDSLLGATRALAAAGIPDAAYSRATARTLIRRNRRERAELGALPAAAGAAEERARLDLWTAAFFLPLATEASLAPTTRELVAPSLDSPQRCAAAALAAQLGCFHWELEFPEAFDPAQGEPGFDVVLGNPPWERIKLQEQEHFHDVPAIVGAANKAERARVLAAWRRGDAGQRARLARFDAAKHRAEACARFVRASGRFPLTGARDINLYAPFAELALALCRPGGRAGLIVPTGIATDESCRALFAALVAGRRLISLFDFENRAGLFPAVDSRYKFCLLTLGDDVPSSTVVCFATRAEQLRDPRRQFKLTATDLAALNPNTHTCPVFRTAHDAELTLKIHRGVPVLRDETACVSPWRIGYLRMFDMATDSGLFLAEPRAEAVSLFEGKMVQAFDHRAADVVTNAGNAKRPGQPAPLSPAERADPRRRARPRYYVPWEQLARRIDSARHAAGLIVYKPVSSPTNERSLIAAWIPLAAVGHSLNVVLPGVGGVLLQACLLGALNSLVLDYLVRQKLGGVNLSYFLVNQIPVPPPERFTSAEVAFIAPRVAELVYTAWDLRPFAAALWAESDAALRAELRLRSAACNAAAPPQLFPSAPLPDGSPEPFALPPFQWHEERRARARAELDARIARLYGLTRDELHYILDPNAVCGPEFPGETFRALRAKEFRRYGEYRTARLVLEAWDALNPPGYEPRPSHGSAGLKPA